MKRSYIYIIVILLTITLVTSDYIINKDLEKIIPVDDNRVTLKDDYSGKAAEPSTTLTIKNEQNTDEDISYKYTLTIKDISGAYRYLYNEKESYLIFTANGVATFELKSNESIVIYEVPLDTEYTLTQETTSDKYQIKVNNEITNTIKGTTSAEENITFNNSTLSEKTSSNSNSTKIEEENNVTKKEDSKVTKKQIPNTGTKEVKLAIILVAAIIMGFFLSKLKIKRFE